MLGAGPVGPDHGDQQMPDLRHRQCDHLTVARVLAPFFDRVTGRKACASIDNVMCRYQPVYLLASMFVPGVSPE